MLTQMPHAASIVCFKHFRAPLCICPSQGHLQTLTLNATEQAPLLSLSVKLIFCVSSMMPPCIHYLKETEARYFTACLSYLFLLFQTSTLLHNRWKDRLHWPWTSPRTSLCKLVAGNPEDINQKLDVAFSLESIPGPLHGSSSTSIATGFYMVVVTTLIITRTTCSCDIFHCCLGEAV